MNKCFKKTNTNLLGKFLMILIMRTSCFKIIKVLLKLKSLINLRNIHEEIVNEREKDREREIEKENVINTILRRLY